MLLPQKNLLHERPASSSKAIGAWRRATERAEISISFVRPAMIPAVLPVLPTPARLFEALQQPERVVPRVDDLR